MPTVQATLEKALERIAAQPIQIMAAGRTDTGVHATGQVIAFDLDWPHESEALTRALNAHLPPDVAVWQVVETTPTFHPRFDARRRTYVYTIYNHPLRSPLRHAYSWHVSRPLNMAHMQQAADQIVGVHDFATFGTPPQGENSVREVYRAQWQQQQAELVFTIEANAFLYRMVRSLVGAMKWVGEGQWQVADFAAALAARDRRKIQTLAPPQGLVLSDVTYETAA